MWNREQEENMTYYRWMVRKHIKDQSPAGDLAHDMKMDPAFPRRAGRAEVLEYLFTREADTKCIRTFEETWNEYRKKKESVRIVRRPMRERTGRFRRGVRR